MNKIHKLVLPDLNKTRIIRLTSIFLCFFIIMFLTSCKNNDNDDISVKSFETVEKTYKQGEKIKFEICFKNEHKYEVVSVEINKENYSVSIPSNDNSLAVFYIEDENLIYSPTTSIFDLNSFSYIETGNNSDSIKNKKTNNRCMVIESAKTGDDISIKNVSIISKTQEENLYMGEKAVFVINLENQNSYSVEKVSVLFKNDNYEFIKDIPLYINNAKNNNTTYEFECELPNVAEEMTVKINRLFYTKNTKLLSSNFNEVLLLNINLHKRDISIIHFKCMSESVEGNETVYTDLNGNLFSDAASNINLQLRIENPSKVNIESLIINKQKYTIENNMIQKIGDKWTINFAIRVAASSEAGEITSILLGLEAIRFTDKTQNELSMPVSLEIPILIYDKIIKTTSDLSNLKINDSNVITGNYVLVNDIELSDSYHRGFFSNCTLNGLIEGNGKTINFSSDSSNNSNALFNEIGENGIMKNLIIKQGIFNNTNVIANTNNGLIKNINLSPIIKHMPTSSQNQEIRGGLIGINNGTISDIILSGSFSVSGSNINENAYRFSLITDTNNGNIVRIINNLKNITSTLSVGKSCVFLTTRNNNGTISTIVNTLYDVNITDFKPVTLATDSEFYSENSIFVNMYISDAFLYKVACSYPEINTNQPREEIFNLLIPYIGSFDKEEKTSLPSSNSEQYDCLITFFQEKCKLNIATTADLGRDATNFESSLNFYSVLDFKSGGTDNFWKYGNGTIQLSFE